MIFPVVFIRFVCHQTIAFCYQRLLILQWAKTNQHNYLWCKNFSYQSLTRVVTSSYYTRYYSKRRCGLDNLLVSIATFNTITCRWSASKNHCQLLLQYHVYSDNCADECLHGISGQWVAVVHVSWLLHNKSTECCCLLLL